MGLFRKSAGGSKRKRSGQARQSQIRTAFTMASQSDPRLGLWVAVAFFVPIAIGLALAFTLGPWILWILVGVAAGLLATTITFTRRAETAMYSQVEGQEGSAGAALSSVRKGWTIEREPVAIDTRTHDMIFRAVGRGGIVLVTEGPTTRVKKLVDSEKRRLNRVAPNAPIHVINTGNDADQVKLRKVARTVQRIRPTLTKAEADSLAKRLKSLGGLRPATPKGMDPGLMRVSSRRARRS